MPTPQFPAFTLKVAGSVYDLYGTGANKGLHTGGYDEWIAYRKDGAQELSVFIRGGALPGLPDPLLGKQTQFLVDTGSGATLYFAGDFVDCAYGWTRLGWGRRYTALGLPWRADRVPVTNSNDGTDLCQFNLAPDDPKYTAALAGRSCGQILQTVLDFPDNNIALTAKGVGNYNSQGWGATAVATVSGGAINTVTPTSPGRNYAVAPHVVAYGGGGTGAVITANLGSGATAGQVVSYTINNGGSAFVTAPQLLVSPLPVVTLQDLAKLLIISPYPVAVQGERIYQSLVSTLASLQPNHTLQIDQNGNFRIFDLRNLPSTVTYTMGTDPIDVENVQLTRTIRDNFSRVLGRGQPYIQPVELALSDNTLTPAWTAQQQNTWTLSVYIQPGQDPGTAQFSANLTTGTVSSLTLVTGGFNYGGTTPAIRIRRGPGDTTGSGASYTAVMGSGATAGQVVGSTKVSAGSLYTAEPIVEVDEPNGGNGDSGTCTMPSTTQFTVTSSDPAKTWAANYWDQSSSGRHAFVTLTNPLDSTINIKFAARIITNTALTAGGTSTLTMDTAAPNVNYTEYALHGLAGPNQSVWQTYNVNPAAVAQAMQSYFPWPVPWRSADGNSVTLTSAPVASILWSIDGNPPYAEAPLGFTIDYVAGQIHFVKPVVTIFGTPANLQLGGSHVDGIPTDIRVLMAVANGVLNAVCPANGGYYGTTPQYAGTCYTVEGIQDTLTVSIPQWRDPSNLTNMIAYACEVEDSVKDTVVEGDIPYLGWNMTALSGFGLAVNLTGNGYTTGFESLNLPLVQCGVKWTEQSGAKYVTTMHVSNRRSQFTSELFSRPPQLPALFGGGGNESVFLGGSPDNFPQYGPAGQGRFESIGPDVEAPTNE